MMPPFFAPPRLDSAASQRHWALARQGRLTVWPAFTTVPRFIQRVVNLREQFSAVEGHVALSDEPEESLAADGLVPCVH